LPAVTGGFVVFTSDTVRPPAVHPVDGGRVPVYAPV